MTGQKPSAICPRIWSLECFPETVPLRNIIKAPNLHASQIPYCAAEGKSRAVHVSGSWSLSALPPLCLPADMGVPHHWWSPQASSGAPPHAEEFQQWTPVFYLQAFIKYNTDIKLVLKPYWAHVLVVCPFLAEGMCIKKHPIISSLWGYNQWLMCVTGS